MNGRVLHQFEDVIQSLPAYELQFVPTRQTVVEFPRRREASETQDGSTCMPRCIRGIQAALAIEAVVALTVYGLWQLTHLLR